MPKGEGILNGLSKTVKASLLVLALAGSISSAVIWLFATFATAGDVQQIRKDFQLESVEVKLLILEGRREQLVRERLMLEGQVRNALDRQRLGLIVDHIEGLGKQIDKLRDLQNELQKK